MSVGPPRGSLALTKRGGCDFIGACASRHPSLFCPLAGLVRAALPGRENRTVIPTMTQHDATTQLSICDTAVATENPAATFQVVGGVDTHKDTNTAAVIDTAGRTLGVAQFPTTPTGYAALLAWLRSFGAPWRWSGSRAPAPTERGLPCICTWPVWRWSRSTARNVKHGVGRANPTRWTPRPPPGPR